MPICSTLQKMGCEFTTLPDISYLRYAFVPYFRQFGNIPKNPMHLS